MKNYTLPFILLFFSCTLEDKNFDNPIDFEANEELGIGAPTTVFYPAKQVKAIDQLVTLESHIVFKEDSTEEFSGIHLQINYPNNLLSLDTVFAGAFITDSSQLVPLFNYMHNDGSIDIYAYFLDTLKLNIEGTGEIAKITFQSKSIGSDSIYYNLEQCELINSNDEIIQINGTRSAEITVE
tara:strand:+ start:554 stop:1099 length:546 start_codon:yes stop_codon:yes gene_type:complete